MLPSRPPPESASVPSAPPSPRTNCPVTSVFQTRRLSMSMRVGPLAGATSPSEPAKGPRSDCPSVSMAKPSPLGASATRTSFNPAEGYGSANTRTAVGPSSASAASTVNGPYCVWRPLPARLVRPSSMLPSRLSVSFSDSSSTSRNVSGSASPSATPPRRVSCGPARLAMVALVTLVTRPAKFARKDQGAPLAVLNTIFALAFAVPTLSSARSRASMGPASANAPWSRFPRKARRALRPGNATLSASLEIREPL